MRRPRRQSQSSSNGTLKRGYWNHDRYCRNVIDICRHHLGRSLPTPRRLPRSRSPPSHILAYGTADAIADGKTQARLNATAQPFTRPTGDWHLIHGELITLPARNLPSIDHLEGFRTHNASLYHRILITMSKPEPVAGWTYSMKWPRSDISLVEGKWG